MAVIFLLAFNDEQEILADLGAAEGHSAATSSDCI